LSKILTPARTYTYIHIVSSCRNVIPIVLPSLVATLLLRLFTVIHCIYIYSTYVYIHFSRTYVYYIYLHTTDSRERVLWAIEVFDVPKNNNGALILILYTYVSLLLWWDVIVYNVYCKCIFAAGALNETRRRWSCRWAGVGTRELWPDRVRWSSEWFERSSLRDFLQLRYGSCVYIYILPRVIYL